MATLIDLALYGLARILVWFVQALPLTWVACLGQLAGLAGYYVDRRHRRVALENLTRCFGGEMAPPAIRRLARRNFRRIGENFAATIKTAAMGWDRLKTRVTFMGIDKVMSEDLAAAPASRIMAVGHFGNFEIYARLGQCFPAFQCATTYRKLPQPALNRLFQSLRERSGCRYYERCEDGAALKAAMKSTGFLLGLLSDQHAGDRGLAIPFFGQESSTISAPALFALRYGLRLNTAICYRVGLARWQIEIGEEIPTHQEGRPRPLELIMADVNRSFEMAIRRDPANWFWVHRRWKTVHRKNRAGKAASKPPEMGSCPAN